MPNDIAIDSNRGETPAVDTREAEIMEALQPNPPRGKLYRAALLLGPARPVNSPLKLGTSPVSHGKWVLSRTRQVYWPLQITRSCPRLR